jgi:hypothetical protein
MAHYFTLTLVLLSAPINHDHPFRSAAAKEITAFVENELLRHYDVHSLSLLSISDPQLSESDSGQEYVIRAVTARFSAVRNAHWSDQLNREIPKQLCDSEVELYLFCRPNGHQFSGTLEVDMVFTVEGWKILSRHHRSLRAFPLSGHLDCDPDPAERDPDLAVIRACFEVAP